MTIIKKLHEISRSTEGIKIRLMPRVEKNHPIAHRDFEKQEELTFFHVDGMYSYCEDADGNPVHVAAWTEVEIL